jgi:hypothetical protein
MIDVGFTGTQRGMTRPQLKRLNNKLIELNFRSLSHGDCIGADAQAHDLSVALGRPNPSIYPPEDKSKRAFKHSSIIYPPKPYLLRNHDIVDNTDLLIGCPAQKEEQLRSGTWATIRYAKKQGKRVVIIYPDGTYDDIKAQKRGFF